LLVAQKGGKTLGTATLIIQRNLTHEGKSYGHIENVVIDHKYKGNGLGRARVLKLLNIVWESNCYKITLDCSAENIPFYEKSGFERTGEVEMRVDFGAESISR
jgi:glucosamine-phosphate N-acetyltransferase